MLIPNKHTGHTRDGIRRVFFGGDDSGPTSTTQTVDLPPWAKETGKEALGAAGALVFNRDAQGNITGFRPYELYQGERGAQFTPLQQQAFQAAGQQGIAGQIGQATGIAGQAATRALGAGAGFSPYQTGQFGAQAASYMSPYMQNVVDIQQREAQRQADIAGTQRAAEATKAGAFGGGRQAIVEAEAARNLALQKGDIQAQGLQAAYDQAQAQFNREQQLAEQSRQYGAGLGLQGFQTALQGAGALGTLGGQQFAQQMDITQQQAQLGQTQQQQVQAELDRRYQDFLAQQKAPYQQLEFLMNQARGLGSTTSMYSPQPSLTSQLLGAGTALAGFAAAEGGEVPGYAEGGITALLGDEQLAQRQQMPTISTLARLAAEKEAAERAQLRQGIMAAQQAQTPAPQGTVADEVAAGLMAADVPDSMFADGGIVAFQSGGYTPFYQQAYEQGERKGSIYDPRFGAGAQPVRVPEAGIVAAPREIVLPAGTSNQERALVEMQNPDAVVRVEGAGGLLSAIGRGLTYSSDVEAAKASGDRQIMTSETARRAALGARTPTVTATPATGIAKIAPPTGAGGAKIAPPTGAGGAKPPVTTGATRPTGIAAAAPAGAEGYMSELRRLAGSDAEEARIRQEQEAINAAAAKGKQTELEEFEAEQKALGPAGAAREKSLAAQEERLSATEKKNFKNTLIEAGLAIMAGQSPNALTNIAQGAAAGLKGYQARLDKVETERQRLDESRIRLEELRREEAMATGDKRRALRKEIRDTELAGKQALTKINVELYGAKSKQAETAADMAFKASESEKQRQNALQIVRTQMSGAGGGGRGAGSGLATVKEARMNLTAQLNSVQKDIAALKSSFKPEDAEVRRGLQAQAAQLRAQLAALGPDTGAPVQSQATPATRLRFDAQGNLIQ